MPERAPAPQQSRGRTRPDRYLNGVPVLDVIFIVATVALFALVGLIAKAVERL